MADGEVVVVVEVVDELIVAIDLDGPPGDKGDPGDASGTVTSFNTRTGAVTSQVGDYSAFYDPLGAAAAAQTASQPSAATLTALAALSTTIFGRALLTLVDAAALRTAGALGTVATLASDTDGTLAANSDSRVPTQKAVLTAINALLAASDAEVYKGPIDCSANPNYPAADAGHVYRVSVAGKIGGASGINVEVNDRLQCLVDGTAAGNQATVGASWWITQANIDGAVIGPASATDNYPALFNGATGKIIKAGSAALGDAAYKSTGTTAGTLAAGDDSRITGAAQKSANLSDLASAPAARGSLGSTTVGDALFIAASAAAARSTLALVPGTNIPSGSGTSTGANTGDQTSVSGNAGTATALQTARALNGVNFDGTAAITVPIPLARTAVKTTSYTAVAGDLVPVDTTSGAVTITLPTAPADKSIVAIKHIIQGGTNAVAYQCGGSDVFNKAGGATSGTLPLLAQGVLVQYNASTSVWTIVADDLALSQLDLRYVAATALDTDGTLAANSDSKIATQKAIVTYIANKIAGLLHFQNSTNCSGNPNYPTAVKGDAYIVSVAGKIGGTSGKSVDIGDVYVASADNAGGTEASVGTSWFVLEHNLVGALLTANALSELSGVSDTALGNLGGTTVGKALFKLANPSAITFPKIAADNSVSARTAAQMRADLGTPAQAGSSNEITFDNTALTAPRSIVVPDRAITLPTYIGEFTWANLLAVSSPQDGWQAMVTDVGANRSLWIYSAARTRWLPVSSPLTLKMLGAQVTGIGTTETIVLQTQLPAIFLLNFDTLRVWLGFSKSGITDTGSLIFRLGTAGTTADTAIQNNSTAMSAANLSLGCTHDFSLVSATQIQHVGLQSPGAGTYGGGGATAQAAAVTISNVSNSLYLSVSTKSSGATDTIGCTVCQIQVLK